MPRDTTPNKPPNTRFAGFWETGLRVVLLQLEPFSKFKDTRAAAAAGWVTHGRVVYMVGGLRAHPK